MRGDGGDRCRYAARRVCRPRSASAGDSARVSGVSWTEVWEQHERLDLMTRYWDSGRGCCIRIVPGSVGASSYAGGWERMGAGVGGLIQAYNDFLIDY